MTVACVGLGRRVNFYGMISQEKGPSKKKSSSPSFHGKAIMKIPKISQLSQYVSRLNAMSLA